MNKLLRSSADPEKISLTVKGLLTGLIPLAIYFFRANDVEIGESEMIAIVNEVTALIASLIVVYGGVRKIINAFSEEKMK